MLKNIGDIFGTFPEHHTAVSCWGTVLNSIPGSSGKPVPISVSSSFPLTHPNTFLLSSPEVARTWGFEYVFSSV